MIFKLCTDKTDPYVLVFVEGELLGKVEIFDENYVFSIDRPCSLSMEEMESIVNYTKHLE